MDSVVIQAKCLWTIFFIVSCLCAGTYSDIGKSSSTNKQNHFQDSVSISQFTTKNNTRVIAQKGGLAILPCAVKLTSHATVSWIRRKDFQLLTVGLSTHSTDGRFLVEHTRHMGHWSLRIKSVKDDDRGFYECQLSVYPTQSILIELRVVEAVAEISGAPDLHIDEGSTLRLECKLKRATENPAFVFWYHDDKMVNYDSQDGFSVTSTSSSANNLNGSGGVGVSNNHNGGFNNNNNKNNNINNNNNNNIETNNNKSDNSNSNMENLSGSNSNGGNGGGNGGGGYSISSNSGSSSSSSINYIQTQSHYLTTPSTSVLTINKVHFNHAGNYTCKPSNARPSSITVHVLRGEKPAAMQHANRSQIDDNSKSSGTTIQLLFIFNCQQNNNIIIFYSYKFSKIYLTLIIYLLISFYPKNNINR